jgi:uncharacterized membrane protein YhaH (DUF805 family)
MNYYLAALKKYAEFSGRARRAEYWYFVLFNFLILIALNVISVALKGVTGLGTLFGIILSLYALAMIVPGLAVSIRRLHDTNRSGWWLLIDLIPFIGLIVILIFTIEDSQPGTNQYGPNPKAVAAPAAPTPPPAASTAPPAAPPVQPAPPAAPTPPAPTA